ncbi:MAG: hypothetical protein HOE82_14530 [Gammaproteobacteria bacterium]|jgi:hypothetical protein|nr:hypothetical protein [Gammaproteobacteria bacterium]
MNTVFILTEEHNEYNQYGEYFLKAYRNKPTFKQLKEQLPLESNVVVGKLTRGGGRHGTEDVWYYLKEEALC